jgi:outer membrane receptor for Fe3+-dicitrate
MLKLSYAPENSAHGLELKWQVANQNSEQRYLGLTDEACTSNSDRRYGLLTLAHIDTEHDQLILRRACKISDKLKLMTTLYNNGHNRDWFKTEGFDAVGADKVFTAPAPIKPALQLSALGWGCSYGLSRWQDLEAQETIGIIVLRFCGISIVYSANPCGQLAWYR